MTGLFSNMVFLHPIILSALLALPLLWYFLRITPPAPKKLFFPATRFLSHLKIETQVTQKTPWWILLLRMLIAGLIILALANPVLHPSENALGEEKAVRIIMDNSWASAQSWNAQQKSAEEILAQSARAQKEVYILTTAPRAGEDTPLNLGPMIAEEARVTIQNLKPLPWPADYDAMKKLLEAHQDNLPASLANFWFSNGLDEGRISDILPLLQRSGSLTVYMPTAENLPLLLRSAKNSDTDKTENSIKIAVDAAPQTSNAKPFTVQAQGKNSDILDIKSESLNIAKLPQDVHFDIQKELAADLTTFRIGGPSGAGGLFLINSDDARKKIGIAAPSDNNEATPLIEANFYLTRALEPYADLILAPIDDLIKQNLPMIIMPDITGMPPETLNALEDWVKKGGLLLRFSGPNMSRSAADEFLLPVTLRAGERSLSGALSWETPQSIAPFSEKSPIYGLPISSKLQIKQQILADPAQDNLDEKVWARLEDGTPIITAKREESGLIILVHTTADPSWSDLPLSGLFVDILKRISQMAGRIESMNTISSVTHLDPILIMDGQGNLSAPKASDEPLSIEKIDQFIPDSKHPPGLYGRGAIQFALNLGNALPRLNAITTLPLGAEKKLYEGTYEIDLMPYLLWLALLLFSIDWLAMIFIVGGMNFRNLNIAKNFLKHGIIIIAFLLPTSSHAQTSEEQKYALGLYLAYIESGDPSIDSTSRNGLESLAATLAKRTSVEPQGAVGLDPEHDELSFFPILYWPITSSQKSLSGKAYRNIQNYLDHGGTILFDTRDESIRTNGRLPDTENAQILRQITSSLTIPPLAPIAEDHVLSRSFYLLKTYPGALTDGTIWLEDNKDNGRDGVSSVLIGSNDWARAWAQSETGGSMRFYGARNDNEMALRFGVNLVMYALTGNYKADQVHIPHILERLGK